MASKAGSRPPRSAPRGSARGKAARGKRDNVHRNVHIKQEDPAIWEHFRARTVQGTKIFIGKNTIIGPGVNIIAEKGTITIGDNNIISEGTLIINKSKEELIIGNGNRFECGARIEAAKINDYNVFGAKCHVMAGALIGTGCVICPRVMVIAKKRIRDCMVVFGENMIHEQPLNKKRNRAYIDQMVKVLCEKFKEIKKKPSSAQRSGRRPGGSTRSRVARPSPNATSSAAATMKLATKSRPEVPVAKASASKEPAEKE